MNENKKSSFRQLKQLTGKVVVRSVVTSITIFALSGCASIIKGNNDNVSVNSMEKGTIIYVDGAQRGIDSTTVNVKKGKPHILKAEKEGCQSVTTETGESFDGTSLLGILIDFGIITIPVDLISGAAWKTDPTTYTLTPICNKDTAQSSS